MLQELIEHAQSDQDTDTNQQNIDLCFQGNDVLFVSINFMSCFGGSGIRRARFYKGFVEIGAHDVSITLPAEPGKAYLSLQQVAAELGWILLVSNTLNNYEGNIIL